MKKVKWVVHAEDIIEVDDDMSEDEIWEEFDSGLELLHRAGIETKQIKG